MLAPSRTPSHPQDGLSHLRDESTTTLVASEPQKEKAEPQLQPPSPKSLRSKGIDLLKRFNTTTSPKQTPSSPLSAQATRAEANKASAAAATRAEAMATYASLR